MLPSAGHASHADEADDPLLGRLLDDRYSLDALLAHGGMATVYRATDTRLDRTVAVKVMARRYADDQEFVSRFTREAKASARLSSPHVVAVHDYGTDHGSGTGGGLAYLVMELVEGRNLRQLLQQSGPLPPARAVELVEHVLQALGAAHSAGLVHRDIKPENVLLADDGRVKVADFGLARAVETNNLTATTGLLLGTVAYLAPEQVVTGRADARSDVYATGVLLWELLTGTPPHCADSPLSVAYKHVNEDVPAASTAVEGIPPALDALVVRATSRDPSARPADGSAFLAELRAVQPDLPPAAPVVRRDGMHATQVLPLAPAAQPVPASAPPRRRRRRRGLIAAAVVLLLALLALGGGFYLGTARYTRAPSLLRLTQLAAVASLQTAGLRPREGTAVFDEKVPAGQVKTQDPAPAAKVRRGGTVTYVLSKGPDRRVVPTVADMPLAAARAALAKEGLTSTTTSAFSTSVRSGSVVSEAPPAGTKVKPGTPVMLVVSKGIEQVAVTDETGKTQYEAGAVLEAAGFRTTVTTAFSDTVAKGTVLSQSPVAGRLARGSTVALTVSKGPDVVDVPDVRGAMLGAATAKLAAVGLTPRVLRLPGGPGSVLSQSPGRGTTVHRGSSVTLYVF